MHVRLRLYLEGETLEALQDRAGKEYRRLEAQATVELMRALGTWQEAEKAGEIATPPGDNREACDHKTR